MDAAGFMSSGPTQALVGSVVDRGFQVAFVVAHRLLRAWWFVRRPRTHGALVAVWHDGEVLIVKNSYRDHYTLPGGYARPSESALQAGLRELREEVGLEVPADTVKQAYEGSHPFEFRDDFLTIIELSVDERPRFEVDRREVVWAGFLPPDEILRMPIVPHLREYLRAR